jgi:hypothetical protein
MASANTFCKAWSSNEGPFLVSIAIGMKTIHGLLAVIVVYLSFVALQTTSRLRTPVS